jgi:hypothetical protein
MTANLSERRALSSCIGALSFPRLPTPRRPLLEPVRKTARRDTASAPTKAKKGIEKTARPSAKRKTGAVARRLKKAKKEGAPAE